MPYRLLCPVITRPYDFIQLPSPNTRVAIRTDCPLAFAELLVRGGKCFFHRCCLLFRCEIPQLLSVKAPGSAAVWVLLVCPVTLSATAGGNLAGPGEASHIKHWHAESHVDCATCLLPAWAQLAGGRRSSKTMLLRWRERWEGSP